MANSAIPSGDAGEGSGKGNAFFERAKIVAETGNYDYAIDMYVEGFNRDPQNIPELERLYNVSLTRKVKGGKPASGLMGPKVPYKGKTPKEQMLNAMWVLAHDPGHIPSMLTILKNAVPANCPEVAKFIGPIIIHANRTSKSPKKDTFVQVADVYEQLGEFLRAADAVQAAAQIDPLDMDLQSKIKDLSAQETIKKGKYTGENDDFKDSLKDRAQTKELLQQENLVKSEDFKHSQVEKFRADYEKNPTELQVITKYVKSLIDTEEEPLENTAIEVLYKAFVETKTYRYKFQLGEIKLRQHRRAVRALREELKSHPQDTEIIAKLEKALKEQLAFELVEYKERTDNFPTDMPMLYEYGQRLYRAKRYEDAIGALQIAQNNAKFRSDALHVMGRCFMHQGMKPEAMETLKRAVDEYDLAETGDGKSKEFNYQLARAYEDNSRVPEAIQIYSKIAQWDFNYKDVRQRLKVLRDKEKGGGTAPA